MNKDNCRFPQGKEGVETLLNMNEAHKNGAIWALSNLQISPNSKILDIGCGGGANIKRISEISKTAKIYGVDYSPTSVEVSSQLNADLITQKRVEISLGNIEKLNFSDDSFDIVTAFETIYFWPEILENFKEVKRVLKNDGLFFVFLEGTTKETLDFWSENVFLKNKLQVEEVVDLLKKAGFMDVKFLTKKDTEKTCFFGKKGKK